MLPVILYGCGMWPLTLGEVPTIRVFEDRLMRRKFGPRRDKMARRLKICILKSFINGEWCLLGCYVVWLL
jgi:hypothetical protein